jgi:signal peptidase I
MTWKNALVSALAAAALALVLKIFVLGAFRIPSHSMEHTLLPGDHIVVSKLAYLFSQPQRGDVVVFKLPHTTARQGQSPLLIKRIVGIAGDSIHLTPTGIEVNGRRLPDPPLAAVTNPLLVLEAPLDGFVIPSGMVYVVGDNRANSYDSRSWGFLPQDNIEGQPLFIYWSWAEADSLADAHVRYERLFNYVR